MYSTFPSYHLEETNYFVQHQTTVMSWCKLTNMTTCFTGKSFVWTTQKRVTKKPTGEKLPQYLQKVKESLWVHKNG
jgi:hypothetical protein